MAEQVIDASIAIKWLIDDEPFCDNARKLLFDAKQAGLMLIAPPILVYEVESVLQFRLRRSLASLSAVDESLATFYDISVKILTHPDMVIYARKIARSFQQNRIYDSLYAALMATIYPSREEVQKLAEYLNISDCQKSECNP